MPFIEQERRELIDKMQWVKLPGGTQMGDLCYDFYKDMVDTWKAQRRWTTAHEIYRDVITTQYGITVHSIEEVTAKYLAWQCFFYFYVLPYEEEKRKINGDI